MDNFEVLQEKIIGLVSSGNLEEAYNLLVEGHSKDDSNSTCLLGDMYYYGIGMTEDIERSVELYSKALEMGNPQRAHKLGAIYERGKGVVVEDAAKGFYYYSRGAELGDVASIGSVAFCYMYGKGTPEDFDKALFYGLQAAKLGDYDGMLTVATCYDDGLGTSPDAYAAAHWYRELLLIDEESTTYMYRISICLADIFGNFNVIPTREMLEEAFDWASKAVERGHVEAHAVIAWFYERGDIVRQDFNLSHKYLTIAADNGDEVARKMLRCYRKNIYGQLYIPN